MCLLHRRLHRLQRVTYDRCILARVITQVRQLDLEHQHRYELLLDLEYLNICYTRRTIRITISIRRTIFIISIRSVTLILITRNDHAGLRTRSTMINDHCLQYQHLRMRIQMIIRLSKFNDNFLGRGIRARDHLQRMMSRSVHLLLTTYERQRDNRDNRS